MSIQALSPALCADLVAASRAAILFWSSGLDWAQSAVDVANNSTRDSFNGFFIYCGQGNLLIVLHGIIPHRRNFLSVKLEFFMWRAEPRLRHVQCKKPNR